MTTITLPTPKLPRFNLRHLVPFLRELDALQQQVHDLQEQLQAIHNDPHLHQKIADNIDLQDIEICYSKLAYRLDYSDLSDYISYSELADEVDTEQLAESIADSVDIDAVGDALVSNNELTERVGKYLMRKSLRFEQ